MPGIFGIVDASGCQSDQGHHALLELLQQMSAAMCYESAYAAELVACPALGAYAGRVGFVASASEAEPTENPTLTILTAGEPLLERCETDRAVPVRGRYVGSSGRALLPLYRQVGNEAFGQLDGSFAGFVIDRAAGTCVLFTDRYGVERIFLHTDGARIFFASEAKAILSVAPKTRGFDPQGLAEFLGCGGTLGIRSLYCGIEVVPGGTCITFRPHEAVRRQAYFDRLALETLEAASERQFVQEFSESLRSAVNEAVGAPPKAAISLTGGLDSRMIMACLEMTRDSVPSYTFGSMYRDTWDVMVSRAVAACTGQPHSVLQLGDQFLADIQSIVEHSVYVSDGYIGLSGAAELFLNRIARSIALVRVTGNWGGELLRGVRAFKYLEPKGNFLVPELGQYLKDSASVFAHCSSAQPNALSYTLFQQMPVQGYGRYAVERSQVIMRAPFLRNNVVAWLYRAPVAARHASDASVSVVRRRPELLTIPTDMGLLGASGSLMTFGRRLQRRLSFKAEYLISHGAPNWLAMLTASKAGAWIEEYFLGLHKFQHFRRWFRSDLALFVKQTLLDEKRGELATWFHAPAIERIVADHIAGRGNYTDEIDKLLTVVFASHSLLKVDSRKHLMSSPMPLLVSSIA